MEAPHRPAGPIAQRRHREARMVCDALEDTRCSIRSSNRLQGCRYQRLRTAERLANLISPFCILDSIFWMTVLNRSTRNCATGSDRDRNRTARPIRKG